MLSKQAISYDLHEARELLATGQALEARKQIDRIVENLGFLLSSSGGRKKAEASGADQFGRNNVEALRALCDNAAAAIARRDNSRALKALHDAQHFWDDLPAKPATTGE